MEGENYSARLVVDSLVANTSSGGVRIAPEVPEGEVRALAREMSRKYSYFRLQRGGAKAGIAFRGAGPDREHALLDVGRRLGSLLRKGVYYPGMDMGCSEGDLRLIYRGAGIELGGITDTSFFTALSVRDTLLSCVDALSGKVSHPVSLGIAGLGRVAVHLLHMLPAEEFRVVAFSTVEGARRSTDGFPAKVLTEGRERHGDAMVSRLSEGEAMPAGEVYRVPVDILIPSARTLDIDENNVGKIRAQGIVPIANVPVSSGAVLHLHEQGVMCLPGFVANAGGVYASGLFDRGVPVPEVDSLCARYHRRMVDSLLRASTSRGLPPGHIAERVADRHLEEANATPPHRPSSRVLDLVRKRIGGGGSARAARGRFTRDMERLIVELEGAGSA
jgi:glutamate dehydrogenase/leucine dehydrogenase